MGLFVKNFIMKKILFPTDFSSAAENAFLNALALAQKIDASVTLLHVYQLPELGRSLKTTTKEVYEMMEMEELEAFKKSVNKLRELAEEKNYGSIDLDHIMAEGETVYQITKIAKKIEANYIVLGTTGATGLKEIFLGSVASGVIDESSVKVISVPEKTVHHQTIERIAYLTNYQTEEIPVFHEVIELAKMYNAQVYCLHFDGDDSCKQGEEMQAWKEKVSSAYGKINYSVLTGNDFEEELLKFNDKEDLHLLAVLPRKKNIFARLFSKSVSKRIAHHLNIPLLTFPKI
jgi:nucleotide-binding universal stress UspA family protein